jgi:hypothetical protein
MPAAAQGREPESQYLIEELAPLIISVGPVRSYDDAAIAAMNELYEKLWAKGERYALINLSPSAAENPTARSRKLIVDWASRPRVKKMAAELCVAAATIVPNPFFRGALTAILWLWTPPMPHLAAGTAEEAVAYTTDAIVRAKLPTRIDTAQTRARAGALLRKL